MYRAFEESNEKRRVRLAEQALEICPDCADAYVLLAENATSRKEALRLYQQGVAAGERALGTKAFQQDVGRFWGILETRPYMRRRLGLAHVLWSAGHRDEAVQHLQEMLRLNPGDNQGVRYTLAGFLLFLDRDDDWPCCFGSPRTKPRLRGRTPRPCSPFDSTATRSKPASCSRKPGRGTSMSPHTCWARSFRRPSNPATTAPVTRARP